MPDAKKTIPTATNLIAHERLRQINEKGYTPEFDDANRQDGSLAMATAMILDDVYNVTGMLDPNPESEEWPDKLILHMREKYQGNDLRKLVIAAALLEAEIDRRLRATQQTATW